MELIFKNMKITKGHDFRKDIKIKGSLGSGNSQVYDVLYKDEQYAMKEIILRDNTTINEIDLMLQINQLNTRFVIKLYDYMIGEVIQNQEFAQSQNIAYLLLERGQMSLTKYVETAQLNLDQICQITQTLINGFELLQKNQIAHRDIKPENILVMEPFALKVCDIGCGLQIERESSNTIAGTISFLAPELFYSESQKIKCNVFKSDVFSLGLCLIYLITKEKWIQQKRQKVEINVYSEVLNEWIELAARMTGDDSIIKELLAAMLQIEPEKRPDFIQLKEIFHKAQQEKFIHRQANSPTIIISPTEQSESPNKKSETYSNFFPRNPSAFQAKQRQMSSSSVVGEKNSLNLTPQTKKNLKSRSPSRDAQERNSSKMLIEPQRQESFRRPASKIKQQKSLSKSGFKSSQQSQTSKFQKKDSKRTIQSEYTNSPLLKPYQTEGMQKSVEQADQRLVVLFKDDVELSYDHEQFLQCDYAQLKQLIGGMQYLSLYTYIPCKQQIVPNTVQYLHLSIKEKTIGVVINHSNCIQSLVVDIEEDNQNIYENISKYKLSQLKYLEINEKSSICNIEKLLLIIEANKQVETLNLYVTSPIQEQDHRLLIQRISKMAFKNVKLKLPQNKFILSQQGQQWAFNKNLQTLHLDYNKTGISSAFGSLLPAIRDLQIQSFYLDITQCFSPYREVVILIEHLGKMPLKELTLIFDNMHQFQDLIIQRISTEMPKLQLSSLNLSFLNINLTQKQIQLLIQTFDKLKECSSTLRIDRVISKAEINQMWKQSALLKKFKLEFISNQSQILVAFLKKMQLDLTFSKCNQGQNIKSSKMYVCVNCTQEHQPTLKQQVQVCALCAKNCHSFDQLKSMISYLIDKQRKLISHSFLDSNELHNRCMCQQIGQCKFSKPQPCHLVKPEFTIISYCKQCDYNICNGCHSCHNTHTLVKMYAGKYICQCDRYGMEEFKL